MDGYVAQRRGRFYAVVYEGRDPVTGKEVRHPAPCQSRPFRKPTDSGRQLALSATKLGATLATSVSCGVVGDATSADFDVDDARLYGLEGILRWHAPQNRPTSASAA